MKLYRGLYSKTAGHILMKKVYQDKLRCTDRQITKNFQPLRFRQIFNFKSNNLCDYLVLSPNDGHYLKNAFWDFDEKANIVKIYTKNSEVLYRYEVIELRDNLLKIKAINP